MPTPATAVPFPSTADPYDHVEWVMQCAGKILEEGEEIASFSAALDSGAIALGVSIDSGGATAPVRVDANQSVQIWLTVDPSFQDNPAFEAGVQVAITLSITTNSTPARKRQRTWVATLVQS
jgi:hypothetical protein